MAARTMCGLPFPGEGEATTELIFLFLKKIIKNLNTRSFLEK
jgi:hypothetical protein